MSVITINQDQTDEDTEETRGRRRWVVVAVVAVLVLAAAGTWFLLRPNESAEPEPGGILPLESTQINLASGHYLKLGIALQLVEGADEVDGSRALDAAIDLFSGRSITDVSKAEDRKRLKEKLTAELEEAYEGEVMSVYFTEFVTQ